ncbi:MAG: hypothetical protein JWL72_3680 [Ilumatobacteraceae bacterium]|nr:hypothetical protein [Ilumatobacteraceae bacterium]
MNEFVTVSSSSYDPASLATKLTEKAGEGWTVVAIVPTGGDVTAFLSREATGAAHAMGETASAEPMMEAAAAEPEPALTPMMPVMTPEPVATPEPAAAEPAGWAVAPDPAPVSSAPATVIQTSATTDYGQTAQPAAQAPAYQPAAAAAPAVPAGWYADPAGRYDLRYWDGGTWTEHVSRAGQQFTDAPVA